LPASFAIVIPVYNEGQFIRRTIEQILLKVRGNYRAYFVYDMDNDTTLPHILSYNDQRFSVLKNKFGKGALNAIKTGLELTKEDYAVVFMADLSEDPKYINDLIAKASEGFDIVCGSRYMKGGAQVGAPKLKSFLSRMAGLSLNLLTGIPTHDISNSLKLYSRKVLNKVRIESTGGFELGMEITIKAYLWGHKIAEVPVIWEEKGESRFNFGQWLPKYLYWYFYLIINRVLRRQPK
jgi:glycosyltransferase involved in cell wall biosynthesis